MWLSGKIPLGAVDTSGDVSIDSDGTVTIHAAVMVLEVDGGILSITGDGTNDIDISNPGANIDIDCDLFTVDTTGDLALNSGGDAGLLGDSTLLQANSGTLDLVGDGSNDINISNVGATIDIDSDIVDIETTDSIDLDAAGAITIDSDAALTLGGASVDIAADGGSLTLSGDSSNDLIIRNAAATIDVDADVVDIETTSTLDLDAAGNLTIDSDAVVFLGGRSVTLEADGGILSLTGDGSNDIDIINAGANIDMDAANTYISNTAALSLDADGATSIGGSSVWIEADGTNLDLLATDDITIYGGNGASIKMSTALDDHTGHGDLITGTVTPAATFGQALHMHTDGTYVLADADDSDLVPCVALAIDTGAGADKSLLYRGLMRDDTWAWTVGGVLYISTTAGGLTQTPPSQAGQLVQAVGFAVTSSIIYFNPSMYWIAVT